MAELADAPDLGSGVPDVKVQVLFGAPKSKKRDLSLFFDFYTDYKLELICVSNKILYKRKKM